MNHTNGVAQASGARILFIADVRGIAASIQDLTNSVSSGKLSLINSMAKKYNAQYVIHTGDFGFYDDESLDRMNEKYPPSPFPLSSPVCSSFVCSSDGILTLRLELSSTSSNTVLWSPNTCPPNLHPRLHSTL